MSEAGIHHVTAFAGPVSRNRRFYTGTLGLRLVKKTVNFDDPGAYHLYYGDAGGAPGTILTFFPIGAAAAGRAGVGETSETAFRVPKQSLGFWAGRIAEQGLPCDPVATSFGEAVLRFKDPDGMNLALVGVESLDGATGWNGGDIPSECAIHGFHGVTLTVAKGEGTAGVLTDVLGFAETAREGSAIRFTSDASVGTVVTLRTGGGALGGRQGTGSVHHVAFRAADDAAQAAMARELADGHGLQVTEQRDRCYFRSVYFREPGGVLFEIATDGPGFGIDEPQAALGEALMLPSFLEPHRSRIEAALPDFSDVPSNPPPHEEIRS